MSFFGDTLTSNDITLGVMIYNLSFTSNHMQEFHTLINQKTALCMHSCLNGRFVTDWTVKNMNPDVTQYRMRLDASVSPNKIIN